MRAGTKRVAWAIGAALSVLASAASGHEVGPPPAASPLAERPHMAVIRQAPDFTLLDLEGRPVRLSALRGRPVLLAFIYTSCTSACPLISFRMARLQEKLARAAVPATLLSVSVDPADDAAALARFAKAFNPGPGWHFLRAEPGRLEPVLASYEEWTSRVEGELDHPARLHLIDAQGRVREIYSLAFFDEAQAFLDLRALAGEER